MGKGSPQQSGPTQTTAYQTNLPEYARPYVETMLGATQKQLFTGTPTEGGGFDITGFKQYQPYSTDPTKYIAGFSPLQQQAQSGAANLQLPKEYGQATGIAGLGALGSLGAGADYQRMATSPYAMSAYMNPYVSASLQPQLQEIQRQGDLAGLQAASQATAAGAFGGTRGQLAQAEAQRAAMNAKQQAIAQGYNTAYGQAQQAQQFGANLGLQGYGQALQGAGQLAGIGSQALQGQQGILGLQNQMGAQQQAQQQNIINQAIQDYATAQQYPLMQLGFMSNMLRGLPMQSTTVQSYQAVPNNLTSTLSGLGTAYGVGKGMGAFKAGGKVQSMAIGGVPNVQASMKAKLEAMADSPAGLAQVQRIAQSSPSVEQRKLANEVLQEKAMEQQAAKQAEASIAQDQGLQGIAAAPAPAMDTIGAATGGIVAFADEGEVEYDPNKAYADPYAVLSDAQAIAKEKAQRKLLGIGEAVSPEYKEFLAKQRSELPGLRERATGWNIADIASNMYQSALERPGQSLLGQLAGGASKASPSIQAREKDLLAQEAAMAKTGQDVYAQERADQMAILTGTDKERKEALDRKEKRDAARLAHSQRTTDLMSIYNIKLKALGAQNKDMNDPRVQEQAMNEAILGQAGRGAAQETKDLTALANATKSDDEIGEKGTLTLQLKMLKLKAPPKDPEKLAAHNKAIKELEDKIAQRKLALKRDYLKRQQTSSGVVNVDNLPARP